MAVLRVVSPYVEKSREKIRELQQALSAMGARLDEEVIDPNQKLLFVEGQSDIDILTIVSADHAFMNDVKILSAFDGGNSSASTVVSNAVAWHFLQKSRKTDQRILSIGLVDGDDAGQSALTEFNRKLDGEKSKYARILKLEPTQTMVRAAVQVGFKPNFALEAFSPLHCWTTARDNGWLVRKSAPRVMETAIGAMQARILASGINPLYDLNEDRLLPFLFDVHIGKKKNFSDIFRDALNSDPGLTSVFKTSFQQIKQVFNGALV